MQPPLSRSGFCVSWCAYHSVATATYTTPTPVYNLYDFLFANVVFLNYYSTYKSFIDFMPTSDTPVSAPTDAPLSTLALTVSAMLMQR